VKYLISKGISADRIIHQKAFGEAKPVASNDTEEGRLRNRRVEFEIFKMK
jgi:outer membrane protein OmpA-like peptidoglycan-associated protein